MIAHTGEDGAEINEAYEGSFRTGLNDAVASYRQLYVFHIIPPKNLFVLLTYLYLNLDPDRVYNSFTKKHIPPYLKGVEKIETYG